MGDSEEVKKDLTKFYVPVGLLIATVILTVTVMMYVGSVVSSIETMANEIEHHSTAIEQLVSELARLNDHSTRINGLEIRAELADSRYHILLQDSREYEELITDLTRRLTYVEAKFERGEPVLLEE